LKEKEGGGREGGRILNSVDGRAQKGSQKCLSARTILIRKFPKHDTMVVTVGISLSKDGIDLSGSVVTISSISRQQRFSETEILLESGRIIGDSGIRKSVSTVDTVRLVQLRAVS